MTDTRRPAACHYDRDLADRVLKTHRDDCLANTSTNTARDCPGRDGCAPCTAPHCVICTREHATNDQPLTCARCIGHTRDDLDEILWLCRHLRWQASRGGRDGHLIAAARIPGGDAMIMMTAGHQRNDQTWRPWLDHPAGVPVDDDHPLTKDGRTRDPIPPLLLLGGWAEQWRRHLDHTPPTRPSLLGIVRYLADHLTVIAQATDGPDWPGMVTDIAGMRRQLEAVLHDEREPERGVSCFECPGTLVRKFGQPKPCTHRTDARAHLGHVNAGRRAAQTRLDVYATYPELGPATYQDLRAARRTPTDAELSAARRPCADCAASPTGQGGIADPSVGQSWECSSCRKAYTPGEYGNAVRRDLLEGGPDGDGWTHIAMAAEAASTQTGLLVPPATVRKWMDRGKVAALCQWSVTVDGSAKFVVPAAPGRGHHDGLVASFSGRVAGSPWGLRLVFWPDVADEAAEAVVRHERAAELRRERAAQVEALTAAVAAGETVEVAGKRLGVHPARVRAIVDERDAAERRSAS